MFGYIDPGSGSMLLAAALGIVSTLFFFLQKLVLKVKFFLGGGRISSEVDNTRVNCVIFAESKTYWNTFKPICDEMENRGFRCEYLTSDLDDPSFDMDYKHVKPRFIGKGNKCFAKLNLLNAHICLATTPGLEVYQWKRSKSVDKYVHLFHSIDEGTGYRMFGLDFYDAVLLSGSIQEYYIRRMEEMRGIPAKELILVGCTYMDALYKKVHEESAIKRDKLTILIAPSWGESSILKKYGTDIINAAVETGYDVIIRPHPQMAKDERKYLDSLEEEHKDIEWNYDNDNYDVLSRADILISDFSSVVFDFAFCFEKPVIYAETDVDLSQYDAAWFDEELWRFRVLPMIGAPLKRENFSELKNVIDELISNDDLVTSRSKLLKEAWGNIGNSAKSIVDYLEKECES